MVGEAGNLRQLDWSEFVVPDTPRLAAEPLDPKSPAVIGYTSGTTGKPKGAVLTHIGFLCMGGKEVKQLLDMRPDETLLWVTDWGWAVLPLWPMIGVPLLGGTAVTFEGAPAWPDSNRLWKIVEVESVNIFGMAATAARIFARDADCVPGEYDLSSLRVLGSTGEPWNESPWAWYFREVGGGKLPIINLCGGTEVTGCFLGTSVVEEIPPCSLGRPAPGMATAAYDADGVEVEPPGGGFLVCKQPWPGMTNGLWQAPERYIETYWSTYDDVWFHGDWAEIDAHGVWSVTGRVDDTIKVSGRRTGPAEIESALVSHPAVREAAVIGIPDENTGESILAFVVLGDATLDDALVGELRAHVTASVGNGAAPRTVLAVPDLPKTRSAKVVRSTIKAVFLGTGEGTDRSVIENPEALEHIHELGAARR
jgi:acetyl-CoA synthetase